MTLVVKMPWTGVETRRNWATNPRVATLTGWGSNGTYDVADRALVIDNQGYEVDAYVVNRDTPTGPGYSAYYSEELPAGQWRAGLRVRITTSSGTPDVAVSLSPDLSSPLAVATVPADGNWHWAGLTFTLDDPDTIYFGPRLAGLPDVDAAILRSFLEEGTTPPTVPDYFTGWSTDTTTRHFEWVGTPDASASIMLEPSASERLDPLLTLAPYIARREAGTVVHRLLDESQQRFTWRQPTLPVGEFVLVFVGHTPAYVAVSKLSAQTAWALVDEADDGTIERWFMVAGGDIEMEQSDEHPAAYLVRVPYVEVDSL